MASKRAGELSRGRVAVGIGEDGESIDSGSPGLGLQSIPLGPPPALRRSTSQTRVYYYYHVNSTGNRAISRLVPLSPRTLSCDGHTVNDDDDDTRDGNGYTYVETRDLQLYTYRCKWSTKRPGRKKLFSDV